MLPHTPHGLPRDGMVCDLVATIHVSTHLYGAVQHLEEAMLHLDVCSDPRVRAFDARLEEARAQLERLLTFLHVEQSRLSVQISRRLENEHADV